MERRAGSGIRSRSQSTNSSLLRAGARGRHSVPTGGVKGSRPGRPVLPARSPSSAGPPGSPSSASRSYTKGAAVQPRLGGAPPVPHISRPAGHRRRLPSSARAPAPPPAALSPREAPSLPRRRGSAAAQSPQRQTPALGKPFPNRPHPPAPGSSRPSAHCPAPGPRAPLRALHLAPEALSPKGAPKRPSPVSPKPPGSLTPSTHLEKSRAARCSLASGGSTRTS